MKRQDLFISVIFISLFSFCNSGSKESGDPRLTDSMNLRSSEAPVGSSVSKDTVDCYKLFLQFFRSSDFELKTMEKNRLSVAVTEMEDSVATIKVYYKDSSTSTNMPLGWLKLDLRDRSLKDVTADPEAPRLMSYDKEILNRLLSNCSLYE